MQINIPLSQEEKLPINAQIPLKWFIFCLWEAEAGEENVLHEQLINATLPGDKSIKVPIPIVPFTFDKPRQRVVAEILGFPITPAGPASITVSLRVPPNKKWKQYAEYPLLIQRPIE